MLLMGDRKHPSVHRSIHQHTRSWRSPFTHSGFAISFCIIWTAHGFFFLSTSSPSEGIYSSRLETSPWIAIRVPECRPGSTRNSPDESELCISVLDLQLTQGSFSFSESIGIYSSCPPTRRVFSATAARQVYKLELGNQHMCRMSGCCVSGERHTTAVWSCQAVCSAIHGETLIYQSGCLHLVRLPTAILNGPVFPNR